ncbi:Histone H4 [Phytophthora palmivora]|uniref:Histone H4 n=1 Tax=Phytophthora palmivora TaxID=4796 RepID=A0A2P4WW96_9STRA|nr:Histone H4 [Phytophthora palmivora]
MSGHGKGATGRGRWGAKQHSKILNTQGITIPAIRRLLRIFLSSHICDAITYAEHGNRKTVKGMDVIYALKRQGRTLYGFAG